MRVGAYGICGVTVRGASRLRRLRVAAARVPLTRMGVLRGRAGFRTFGRLGGPAAAVEAVNTLVWEIANFVITLVSALF